MNKIKLNKRKLMTVAVDTEIDQSLISEAIQLHMARLRHKYIENEDMYLSKYKELDSIVKANNKPNNKLVVNFAKYIVDTFTGYQIGIPAKFNHDDDKVQEFINQFRKVNDMEDNEFELAKMMSVYGHAFFYVYQDEQGETRVAYNSPVNMFIVHDNSVAERPVFAVRYVLAENEFKGYGEVLTNDEIINIEVDSAGGAKIKNRENHVYSKLPVIEAIENEERQGVFDSVKTLINALNKAISEKANDVDYFADAYLKIIGAELDDDVVDKIKDSRVINLYDRNGQGVSGMDASFLDKPNADTTQENLINFLKEQIFTVSMVANITDSNFGNASGTALAYKLQAMDNLAKNKDRKLQSAFSRLYEVVFSVPKSAVGETDYLDIKYQFTRNVPRNTLEEAQIVQALDGQVSDVTKLSVLSIVNNTREEIERMAEDRQKDSLLAKEIERNSRMTDEDLADGVIASE